MTKSLSKRNHRNDLKDTWLKQNTLISFIHSLISSPLSHINYFNYALIAFSLGYFVWDFYDCLQNATQSTFVILIHHIVVILFLGHILLRTRNIGYGIYALSLEINSVFLHARRLLRWYTPITSIYYTKILKLFIDIGNYITFILFRFGVVFSGLRQLTRDAKVSLQMSEAIAQER
jgi:hypothetical protein